MTGLDTNILVRLFAQDDAAQSAQADAIISSFTADDPGWVSDAALLETIWVTTHTFRAGRAQVCDVIETLIGIDHLIIESGEAVSRALDLYRKGNADFADCLISSLGRAAGCSTTLTFDRKAAKTAEMTLAV